MIPDIITRSRFLNVKPPAVSNSTTNATHTAARNVSPMIVVVFMRDVSGSGLYVSLEWYFFNSGNVRN